MVLVLSVTGGHAMGFFFVELVVVSDLDFLGLVLVMRFELDFCVVFGDLVMTYRLPLARLLMMSLSLRLLIDLVTNVVS